MNAICLEIPAGMQIGDACQRATGIAVSDNARVGFTFNGLYFCATPEKPVAELLKEFDAQMAKQSELQAGLERSRYERLKAQNAKLIAVLEAILSPLSEDEIEVFWQYKEAHAAIAESKKEL